MWRVVLITTLLSISVSIAFTSARAAHVRLYETETRPISDYNRLLESLSLGDSVEFGDGRVFRITSEPSRRGDIDLIFKVEEGFALRVPRHLDAKSISINSSYQAYLSLKSAGVQVVQPIGGAYHPDQYLGVEWVDFKYYYSDLIDNKSIPGALREKMLEDLIPFVRSTWLFRNIGDLREDQIVYNLDRGWIILDVIDAYSAVEFANQGTIFTLDTQEVMRNQGAIANGNFITEFGEKLRLPPDRHWPARLLDAIETERRERGMPFTLCRRLMDHAIDWFKATLLPTRPSAKHR